MRLPSLVLISFFLLSPAANATRLAELDASVPVSSKLLQSVPPEVLKHAGSSGWRIARFQREKTQNESYNAVLVANSGSFKDAFGASLFDLTSDQVMGYNRNHSLRQAQIPIGIGCHNGGGGVRYQLLVKSNSALNSKFLQYTVYPSLTEAQLLALGNPHNPKPGQVRLIDFDTYLHNGEPRFCAIGILANQPEWRASGVIAVTKLDLEKQLQADPEMARFKYRVLAIRGALKGDSKWYALLDSSDGGSNNTQLNLALSAKEPGSEPQHVSNRIGSRPIAVSSYPFFLSKLFSVTYIDTGSGMIGSGENTLEPLFSKFDSRARMILRANEIPAASIAIVKNGRLVYAKAYGYSDLENKVVAKPTHAFRLASVSKPITSIAALHAIHSGSIPSFALSSTPFSSLTPADPKNGVHAKFITTRDLLQHRSAFKCAFSWSSRAEEIVNSCADKDESCCPNFSGCKGSAACSCSNGCSVMVPGKNRLNFSQYMNSHYMLIGNVFDRNTPKPDAPYKSGLHQYTSEKLFKPLKISRIFPGGVVPAGNIQAKNYIAPGLSSNTGIDNGTWAEDSMNRLGSTRWAGSAVDLARLLCSADGSCAGHRVIPDLMWQAISEKPGAANAGDRFLGLGFDVSLKSGTASAERLEHGGLLPGSASTRIAKVVDENIWVVILLNSDVPPYRKALPQNPIDQLEKLAIEGAKAVNTGNVNEFGKYGL